MKPMPGSTGPLPWRPGAVGDQRWINVAEVIFYEHPVALNRAEHKDLRLKSVPNMKFAMNTHSVPLTAVEFGLAARDLLIVFAGTDAASAGPIALLGLRQNENLYVDASGQWAPNTYVPAFVRRYPFVLAEKWSHVDTSLFQLSEGLRFMFPTRMAAIERDYPRLIACHDAISELPGIKAYRASDRCIPFNQDGIFRHYPELDAA